MFKTISALAACAALAFGLAGAASAHDTADRDPHAPHTAEIVIHRDIEITGAFTRATLPGAPVGGGYMTLTNLGTADDRLVGVDADFAGTVEIHEMALVDDVMRMRALGDGIAIPAGETVALAPGGYHLMFMNLARPLVEDQTVTVTLVFEQAGPVEVNLAVRPAGARDAGHGSHAPHEASTACEGHAH